MNWIELNILNYLQSKFVIIFLAWIFIIFWKIWFIHKWKNLILINLNFIEQFWKINSLILNIQFIISMSNFILKVFEIEILNFWTNILLKKIDFLIIRRKEFLIKIGDQKVQSKRTHRLKHYVLLNWTLLITFMLKN